MISEGVEGLDIADKFQRGWEDYNFRGGGRTLYC